MSAYDDYLLRARKRRLSFDAQRLKMLQLLRDSVQRSNVFFLRNHGDERTLAWRKSLFESVILCKEEGKWSDGITAIFLAYLRLSFEKRYGEVGFGTNWWIFPNPRWGKFPAQQRMNKLIKGKEKK